MAAQAAAFLIAADVLPPLGAELWDSSHLLDPASCSAGTAHALLGYDARPAGMQPPSSGPHPARHHGCHARAARQVRKPRRGALDALRRGA
jgi:hypothetical protein